MPSSTENVKLGVCSVTFGGTDLGYTKGGCEAEITTTTHKVMVDQFGDTEIDEIIQGRTVKVTVPLAEFVSRQRKEILVRLSVSAQKSGARPILGMRLKYEDMLNARDVSSKLALSALLRSLRSRLTAPSKAFKGVRTS